MVGGQQSPVPSREMFKSNRARALAIYNQVSLSFVVGLTPRGLIAVGGSEPQ